MSLVFYLCLAKFAEVCYTYDNAIQSQMNRMFSIAMISYGVSKAAFSGIDAWFDINEYWVF